MNCIYGFLILYSLFSDGVNNLNHRSSNEWRIINNKLERMCEDAIGDQIQGATLASAWRD
jgi:hypothetical protein